MSNHSPEERRQNRRRGAIAVLVAVAMVAIVGFAALTVDVGTLYTAKAELQAAADAAALAGASAIFTDSGLGDDDAAVFALVAARAQNVSQRNPTLHRDTILETQDIAIGYHNPDSPNAPLAADRSANAVEVTVRRTAQGPNGAVRFIFAPIWQRYYGEVSATARAMASDRLAGYRLIEDWTFIPFTIHEDIYESMSRTGPDNYAFDVGQVRQDSDGVREIKLFPWKMDMIEEELAVDITEGNGNFGTLNIGLGSQGTTFIEEQIRNGISATELQSEFGTSELTFLDDEGNPTTYFSTGNPGLSGGMANTVGSRIGHLVAFFLHRTVQANGANAIYEISGVRYGRIMALDFTGRLDRRSLVVQPVAYTGDAVVIDDEAPGTDGQIGRVILVK